MEYAEHGTLEELLGDRPLEPAVAALTELLLARGVHLHMDVASFIEISNRRTSCWRRPGTLELVIRRIFLPGASIFKA